MTEFNQGTGYVQDIAFRSGIVPGQSPAVMRFVSLYQGVLPPEGNSFKYIDLGCGEGTTIIALASLYPEAEFFGVDFNPLHVETAREAIASLGLKNVTVLEAPFLSLFELDLPGSFDFIAINGIYGWLDPENADAVDRFVGERLREGGLFYVEYLSVPGKIAISAMWRFLQEMVPLSEFGGDARARAQAALELLERLARRGMAFFQHHPSAIAAARHYLTGKKHEPYMIDHFAHNAMAAHFTPRTFTEIHARFSKRGLSFVGRADVELNDLELAVPPAQVPTFREITDAVRRELLKDFIRNEHDRRDIWSRGPVRDETLSQKRFTESFGLLLRVPPERFARQIAAPGGHRIGLLGTAYDMLIEKAYEKVVWLMEFPEEERRRFVKAMHRIISSGQAWPIVEPDFTPGEPVHLSAKTDEKILFRDEINRWLLRRNAGRLTGCQLIAGATGGMAILLSPLETLLLLAASEVGVSRAVPAVLEKLREETKHILCGGGFIPGNQVKGEELEKLWNDLLATKVVNMFRLRLVEMA